MPTEGRDLRAEPTEEQAEALMVQMGFTSISQEDIAILSSALAQAREAGAKERDMEWWEKVILVDSVAPTPEAGQKWCATMNQHAYDEGREAGRREEREAVLRWMLRVDAFGLPATMKNLAAVIERGDHLRRGE